MLLKNFGSMLASLPTTTGSLNILGVIKSTGNKIITSSGSSYCTKFPEKVCDFDDYNTYLAASYATDSATPYTSNHALFIIVGTGDTPPTIDDYKLSGELLPLECIKQGTGSIDNGFVITPSTTGFSVYGALRNNTEVPVTIKEIALAMGSLMNSTTYPMWLLTRDVLPEPAVLQVGEAKAFEVAIDTMSFVTNAGYEV